MGFSNRRRIDCLETVFLNIGVSNYCFIRAFYVSVVVVIT